MPRLRLSLILVLFCVLSAGCESADPPELTFTVRDSAGIEIVESSEPLLGPNAWTISEEPVLQIGEVEGEKPYLFAGIRDPGNNGMGSIFRMSDRRILVCNGQDRTVRIFNGQGEFLQQFGGRGEGPGEFSVIFACIPLDNGFAVSDRGRISFFDDRGVLLETSRPSPITSAVLGIFPDRSLLLSENEPPSERDPGLHVQTRDLFLLSPDGHQSEWRLSTKVNRQAGEAGTQAFSPWAQMETTREEIIYGWAESFDILYYDLNGNLVRNVRRRWELLPVTEVDREWWGSTYRDYERFTGREPSPSQVLGFKKTVDEMIWPDFQAVFDRLYQDRLGHLWVRQRHPQWHARYRYSDVRFPHNWTWDVFDPSGKWLTTLTLPNSLEIHDIGEDYVLGVWKDEFDVEYVRMYSLDRGN